MNQVKLSQALRRWGAVVVAGTVIITSAGLTGVAYAQEDAPPPAAAGTSLRPAPRWSAGRPASLRPRMHRRAMPQDGPRQPGGPRAGDRLRGVARRVAEKFAMQGEVTAIDGNTITVTFERPEPRMGDTVSHETTLTLDDQSILLGSDFSQLNAAEIGVGDAVVVLPRLVWGTPTVALLYQGEAADLTDAVYMGELTGVDGNTLTLTNGMTDETTTVVADSDTIWLDHGEQGRPDTLADGLRLQSWVWNKQTAPCRP